MADYKILIIDYEPRSVGQLRGLFHKKGFEVQVAPDGTTGVDICGKFKPDLTVMEAMLPKKHGFEVCQELKRTEHGQTMPVVILTSVYKGRKYRTQAMHQFGADAYLEKPIDDETLLSTVEALLEKNRPHPAADAQPEPPPTAPGPSPAAPTIAGAEAEIVERLDEVLGGVSPAMTDATTAAEPTVSAPDIDRAVDALAPTPEPRPVAEVRPEPAPEPAPGLETKAEPTGRSGLVWAVIGVVVIVAGAAAAYFAFFK